MLWIMYKIDPSGAFTEVGCIMIDALFYCMLVVCGILSYYQGKKEKERMKKQKFKIIYQNPAGAVVDDFEERSWFVYERDRQGRLIKGFAVPTKEEGIKYLRDIMKGFRV